MAESIGPMWLATNLDQDRLPPADRPRAQVEERYGRITLFSSFAMSSVRLFLDGLLASIARLRFTGTSRLT
jgi:hypothetical protein